MHRAPLLCAAAALIVTALGPGTTGSTPPDPHDPELVRFYGQRIHWGPCPADFEASMKCGRLNVPLDYADPAKGTVDLAVTRHPATGQRRLGSLVLDYGGPGFPSVSTLGTRLKDPARAGQYRALAASYDLVAFDPRGVGGSAPISCAGALPVRKTESMDAAALLRATEAAVRSCRAHSGPVLPYVGTVNVARDMDVLRQALGEPRLHYLGWSYGTRLGAVYAAQFPGRTGRFVLDGVDTLSDPSPTSNWPPRAASSSPTTPSSAGAPGRRAACTRASTPYAPSRGPRRSSNGSTPSRWTCPAAAASAGPTWPWPSRTTSTRRGTGPPWSAGWASSSVTRTPRGSWSPPSPRRTTRAPPGRP